MIVICVEYNGNGANAELHDEQKYLDWDIYADA